MITAKAEAETTTAEKKGLKLRMQLTQLRRCLDCEEWMRSTGPDHRLCNHCNRESHLNLYAGPGSRVTGC